MFEFLVDSNLQLNLYILLGKYSNNESTDTNAGRKIIFQNTLDISNESSFKQNDVEISEHIYKIIIKEKNNFINTRNTIGSYKLSQKEGDFPDIIIKELNNGETNLKNVLDEDSNNTDSKSKSVSGTRSYAVSTPPEEKSKIGKFLTSKTIWITMVILSIFSIFLCFFFWIRVNKINGESEDVALNDIGRSE